MTKKEMYDMIEKLKKEYEDEHGGFIGLRFEDKEREVGEIITDYSRHNSDREDEREFPEYGTEEYDEMEELDGVSAWNIEHTDEQYTYNPDEADEPADKGYVTHHAYVLVSKDIQSAMDLDLDHNEIIMEDAEVIAKLF